MLPTLILVVVAVPFVLAGLCAIAAAVGAGRADRITEATLSPVSYAAAPQPERKAPASRPAAAALVSR